MEKSRSFLEGKINKYIIKGKIIFYEDLFEKGIYRVDHILERDQVKTIDYLHNVGLGSQNIVKYMEDRWINLGKWNVRRKSIRFLYRLYKRL